MEAQRIILIAGLAVVAYLMVLAWNEDYGQPTTSTQVEAIQKQKSSTPELSLGEGELAAETDGNHSGDIPSGSIAAEDIPTAEAETAVITKTRPGTELIEVDTDVLRIKIDPRGGDIVEAALKDYPLFIDAPDNPLLLLSNNAQRKYVAQSGLVGANGPDAAKTRPLYQTDSINYRLADGVDELTVELHLTQENGVRITKAFRFTRGDYLVGVSYVVDNQSGENWQGNFFAQLKRDNSGDPSATTSMGMSSFLGAATTTTEERYKKIAFDDDPFKEKNTGGWIAILQHYFVSAWVPNPNLQHTYQTRRNSQGENIAGLVSQSLAVASGEVGEIDAQLYIGPKLADRLEAVSPGLELTVDYGWLWFIAQPLFWLLSKLHSFVGNWGWAIILTTLCVKLAFFQLSATSYKSMANMRRVGPELARLKERYGDDRQAMSAKMMEIYKKEKINPLGGCLPILVQMPVFIALYWVLLESVELRHAPFIFWLNDLAVKDPYFILPILMGATMLIQQMLNPEPPDPMQAKVMKMMPIMFTFFFLWFPAGLVLYWVVNNILSIAQQWVITRQIENAAKAK